MGTKREGSPLTSDTFNNILMLGESLPPMIALDGGPIAYQRVRIHTLRDMQAAYNLICHCIEHPEVADQLDELVLYNDAWTKAWDRSGTRIPFGKANVNYTEKTHDALARHIFAIGLRSKSTESMLGILNSIKSCLNNPNSPDDMAVDPEALAKTLVVALLSLCKHIKRLQIGTIYPLGDEPGPLEEYIVRSNYGGIPNPGLQNLEIVHCYPGGFPDCRLYDGIYHMELLDCFHNLPALRTIRMTGVNEPDDIKRFLFPPGTGTFSSLQFTHVDICTDGMCAMIRSAKRLEEFKIKTGGLWTTDGSFSSMGLSLLGRRLAEHKSTLHVLDFDVPLEVCTFGNDTKYCYEKPGYEEEKDQEVKERYDLEANEYSHPIGGKQKFQAPLHYAKLKDTRSLQTEGIGSLDEFEELTHLSISPKILMGIRRYEAVEADMPRLIEMLPSSLESLCFYGYEKGEDGYLDKQVQEVVGAVGTRFPGLVEVGGVDELIADGYIEFQDIDDRGSNPEEDARLWKRPDPSDDIGWVKV